MSILALDLGGTKLAVALFSTTGGILSRDSVPLAGRTGDDVGALISAQVRKSMASAPMAVTAVGVSVPGIARQSTGRVWAPNIPGWDDYPLMEVIRKITGAIPVHMDSDRACSILGEQWQGNAKGCRDAIYMAVGTGIGAGILINGDVLRGADDIAGAVGWLALKKPFEHKYIPCGCFEYYASGDGIARYAGELMEADPGYSGPLRRIGDPLAARHVFDAWREKDALAMKVIGECIELWGMAAANFISIFNPEKIIFGGGIFGPAAIFIPVIKAEARKWAQPVSFTRVVFDKSALDGNAAIFGAGFLALQNKNNR